MSRYLAKKAVSTPSPPVKIPSKLPSAQTLAEFKLPEPSIEHLRRLTDDTGLYQHAKFILPDRKEGYCTDDNARAVIVMTQYYARKPETEALKLLDVYMSFVLQSQKKNGLIRNFMNFNRTWRKGESQNDALGRILWACGTVLVEPPSPGHLRLALECFDRSIWNLQKQRLRGLAYGIFGICGYLKRFPEAKDIKNQMQLAAEQLVAQYGKNSLPDWRWFEDVLTYDNGVLPQALFAAGLVLENKKFLEAAQEACEFLIGKTFTDEHFSFVGCQGWYVRGQKKAQFDQQPIEAASMVLMLGAAYNATGDKNFLALQKRAFEWFLGANEAGIPLYDFASKGCCDGLTVDGVNANQGAESILSFLLARLSLYQS